MENQTQLSHAAMAKEGDGLENTSGTLGFQPPAFQLLASGENSPSDASTSNAPMQLQGIDLSTDSKPWDPIDEQESYSEYNDIVAGAQHIGDVGDKIGTHGLFNCCAIVIAVHIKCGKNKNDNRWVVGMHHFSGQDRRKDLSSNTPLTFEDAYNDLRKDTEEHAASLGVEQGTYKVLIPGKASDVHAPAIKALETKMMKESEEKAFNNDWQSLFDSYKDKATTMEKEGNPLRCTAVQVRPGKFKKSNLKIIQKFQPKFGKDDL